MIIVAILFYLVGHFFLPRWIFKSKLKEIRKELGWKNVFIELTGSAFCFLIAILIIVIVTFSSYDKFLLNENAIYGIQCAPLAEEMGFENGDKIVSINDKEIAKFSDIVIQIIMEPNTSVKVLRNKVEVIINISDSQKAEIIKSNSVSFISPRIRPDTSENIQFDPLHYNESKKGLRDAIFTFRNFWKMTSTLFLPGQNAYEGLGYPTISRITSIKGMFLVLALNCIFIVFISLFPIPGLDFGNALISVIENLRKKKFKEKIIQVVRIAVHSLIAIIILYLVFLY